MPTSACIFPHFESEFFTPPPWLRNNSSESFARDSRLPAQPTCPPHPGPGSGSSPGRPCPSPACPRAGLESPPAGDSRGPGPASARPRPRRRTPHRGARASGTRTCAPHCRSGSPALEWAPGRAPGGTASSVLPSDAAGRWGAERSVEVSGRSTCLVCGSGWTSSL